MRVRGFDNSVVGIITNVRVSVRYRTTAAPAKDTYAFEASLDGSFTAPIPIVPETLAHQPLFGLASADLGPISYAEIGTLEIRLINKKYPVKPDTYSVEWDCSILEIFGLCGVPTYTPSASPTPTVSFNPSPTPTPTGDIVPGTGLFAILYLIAFFTGILVLTRSMKS